MADILADIYAILLLSLILWELVRLLLIVFNYWFVSGLSLFLVIHKLRHTGISIVNTLGDDHAIAGVTTLGKLCASVTK